MSNNYELYVDNALQIPDEMLSDGKARSLVTAQRLYPGLDEVCLLFQRSGIPFKNKDDKIAVYYSRLLLKDSSPFSYAFLVRYGYGDEKSVVAEFRPHEGGICASFTNKYQEGGKTQSELEERRKKVSERERAVEEKLRISK